MIYFIATTNIDFIDLIFQVRQWSLVMSQTRTKGIYTGYQNLSYTLRLLLAIYRGTKTFVTNTYGVRKPAAILELRKNEQNKNKKTYIYIYITK